MKEIPIFLFSFFPQTAVTRSGNCTTEGPTPVFKRFGGKGRAIDGRNIYIFFLNHLFILGCASLVRVFHASQLTAIHESELAMV